MTLWQRAELPLGRDEIGGGNVDRGGGKMDGGKLWVVLEGKNQDRRVTGYTGLNVSKAEMQYEVQ